MESCHSDFFFRIFVFVAKACVERFLPHRQEEIQLTMCLFLMIDYFNLFLFSSLIWILLCLSIFCIEHFQVERRQAKSKPKENTGPDSGRTQPVAQKENTESLNATPDKPGGNRDQTNQVTMNEVESHTESVLFEVDEAQETMLGLKSLMTGVDAMQEESSHYATGKGIGLVGSIEEGDEILANMDSAGEDEQLVDAIPSSDRGNDDTHPPVVVGEIVSHVHGGQSPPL